MMLSMLLICLGIVFENHNSRANGDTSEFSVRLNNSRSSNLNEGRLEIYYSGSWGTVCDNRFTHVNARVACASLGYAYIGSTIGNRHRARTDQIWLDNVNCTGIETGLEQCLHDGWGVHNCSHDEDVSISCNCGIRNFTRLTGKITSPRFPMAYGHYLDCDNYIIIRPGQTVIITFVAFDIQANYDWLTITCQSGSAFGLPRFSGIDLPPVFTISSCNLINVRFYSDGNNYDNRGFSLTYRISSDIVKGGFTLKPADAFPDIDTVLTVFNCTTATKYTPWWMFSGTQITNSTCGVIASASYNYGRWFRTETLGAGSCNLIMTATSDYPYLLAGSLVCTDSTLSTATANIATMECGTRNFYEPTEIISSPKFPLRYANNLDCNNYIIVPSGQTVIITFLEVNTHSLNDWVTIICESGSAFRTPRFYGRHNNIIPSVLTISSCSRVNVHFHSDPSGTDRGFSFTYNITEDEMYQNLKLRVSVLGSLFGIALIAIFVIAAILLLPKFRQLQRFIAAVVGQKSDGNEHELQQTEGESNLYANDIGNFVKVDESEYGQLDNSHTSAEPAIYQELRPKPKTKPKIKK